MAKKRKHREMDDGSYSWIHNSLKGYIDEIKAQGFTLYWALTTFTIDKEYVWPSQRTLAKMTALSEPTVNKYLKILANTKPPLIRIEKRRKDQSDVVHLLNIEPRVLKEFKQGTKGALEGTKGALVGGTKRALAEEEEYKEDKKKKKKKKKKKYINKKKNVKFENTSFEDNYDGLDFNAEDMNQWLDDINVK